MKKSVNESGIYSIFNFNCVFFFSRDQKTMLQRHLTNVDVSITRGPAFCYNFQNQTQISQRRKSKTYSE